MWYFKISRDERWVPPKGGEKDIINSKEKHLVIQIPMFEYSGKGRTLRIGRCIFHATSQYHIILWRALMASASQQVKRKIHLRVNENDKLADALLLWCIHNHTLIFNIFGRRFVEDIVQHARLLIRLGRWSNNLSRQNWSGSPAPLLQPLILMSSVHEPCYASLPFSVSDQELQ